MNVLLMRCLIKRKKKITYDKETFILLDSIEEHRRLNWKEGSLLCMARYDGKVVMVRGWGRDWRSFMLHEYRINYRHHILLSSRKKRSRYSNPTSLDVLAFEAKFEKIAKQRNQINN